jgi:hypothetical protein
MGFIGLLMSLVSVVFMFVGLAPLLGWLNWLIAPFAFISLIVSVVGAALNNGRLLGILGGIISLVVMIISIVRLTLGFGII